MRRAAVATAVISAIAIVGALGLGGVATAQSNKPLTKKQFIKQADKICLTVRQQGDEIAARYFGALGPDEQPDVATLAAFWAEYGPLVQGEIDDLRALREPKADRKKVKKLLVGVQAGLDSVTEDPAVLFTAAPFARADRLAQAYGFKVCGASDSND
jgi:hypothetical protein